ncbi:MAG: hypothetical protein IJB64_08760, partial [Akkermansia sp.]|nr:hypothetical protein [Akkermansia sp.]
MTKSEIPLALLAGGEYFGFRNLGTSKNSPKSIVNFKNLPEHSILLILLFWDTATLGRLSASPIPSDH